MFVAEYLQQARQIANEVLCGSGRSVVLCVGNESADIDSVVCSVVFSYLASIRDGTDVIPVINTTERKFRARKDVCYVLERVGASSEVFVFVGEVEHMKQGKVPVVLVDHNEAEGLWCGEQFDVVGVIDHRADSGLYRGASPRIIQADVRSCCTLLASYFSGLLTAETADLLLCGIVHDSNGLSSVCGEEEKTGEMLLGILGKDREEYIACVLQKTRGQKLELCLEDEIEYDQKQWTVCGAKYSITVLPGGLEDMDGRHGKARLVEEISRWMEKEKHFLYCLTFCSPNTQARECVCVCADKEAVGLLAGEIKKVSYCDTVSAFEKNGFYWAHLVYGWELGRKKLQPIVKSVVGFVSSHSQID
ncbi:MAG: inorganic pyrophosphatase/exopolyphosphatase [Amphiamblys sp. WSBS2006]|nr:MAG: inorganic pyrophosphatase/exopolyphosphatase [Amphiamblys sp. WSBS2006]OIR59045.1 MAG: inorganic pyrophosphatase/exopolyphosphatase [Amphiamblys sp. WSBS2006]